MASLQSGRVGPFMAPMGSRMIRADQGTPHPRQSIAPFGVATSFDNDGGNDGHQPVSVTYSLSPECSRANTSNAGDACFFLSDPNKPPGAKNDVDIRSIGAINQFLYSQEGRETYGDTPIGLSIPIRFAGFQQTADERNSSLRQHVESFSVAGVTYDDVADIWDASATEVGFDGTRCPRPVGTDLFIVLIRSKVPVLGSSTGETSNVWQLWPVSMPHGQSVPQSYYINAPNDGDMSNAWVGRLFYVGRVIENPRPKSRRSVDAALKAISPLSTAQDRAVASASLDQLRICMDK